MNTLLEFYSMKNDNELSDYSSYINLERATLISNYKLDISNSSDADYIYDLFDMSDYIKFGVIIIYNRGYNEYHNIIQISELTYSKHPHEYFITSQPKLSKFNYISVNKNVYRIVGFYTE